MTSTNHLLWRKFLGFGCLGVVLVIVKVSVFELVLLGADLGEIFGGVEFMLTFLVSLAIIVEKPFDS